jgi:signal transduction histidine kinase
MKEKDLKREVVDVVRQLRELISDLRPPGLKEFGLEAALEGLLDKLRRQGGPECPSLELECENMRELPEPVSVCLFRVVQESVTNVIKHAGAGRATISLRPNGSNVELKVTDDGSGFEIPKRLEEFSAQERIGLAGMKEREELVKGQMDIESDSGSGTTLHIKIPI